MPEENAMTIQRLAISVTLINVVLLVLVAGRSGLPGKDGREHLLKP